MEGDHRISIGQHYRDIATEKDSRAIFRKFTSDLFEEQFSPRLSSKEDVIEILRKAHQTSDGTIFSLYSDLQTLYDTYPDMLNLTSLVMSMDGNIMIRAYPDLHRDLIELPEETVEAMIGNDLGSSITFGGIQPRIRESICIAFTPPSERVKFYEGVKAATARRNKHLSQFLPDFSVLSTPDERLDAVIKLLTYDFHQALAAVLSGLNLNYADLSILKQNNPSKFAQVHRAAGQKWAFGNLHGILTDQLNGGENNLFDARPEVDGIPQTTDMGQCPGVSYARNYLIGLGRSLAENREAVLGAIKSWDYYKS